MQACVVPMPCGNLRGIGVRSGRASRAVEQFESFYSVATDSCSNFVVPCADVRAAELGDGLQHAVYAGFLSHDDARDTHYRRFLQVREQRVGGVV